MCLSRTGLVYQLRFPVPKLNDYHRLRANPFSLTEAIISKEQKSLESCLGMSRRLVAKNEWYTFSKNILALPGQMCRRFIVLVISSALYSHQFLCISERGQSCVVTPATCGGKNYCEFHRQSYYKNDVPLVTSIWCTRVSEIYHGGLRTSLT